MVDFTDDFPAIGIFDKGKEVRIAGGAELGFYADDGNIIRDVAESHLIGNVSFGDGRVIIEIIERLDGDALQFPVFEPRHRSRWGKGFAGDGAVSLPGSFNVTVDGVGNGGFVCRGATVG